MWNRFKEFVSLFWLNLVVLKRNTIEYARVVYRYYGHVSFLKADLRLIFLYLFKSPYRISKQFLQERGACEIYAYGETPLTTLEGISRNCQISAKDKVYELGCGRGRTCFWLRLVQGCEVVGIEFISDFILRAKAVQKGPAIDRLEFLDKDILEVDYADADVIYLYGTCYDDTFIQKLIKKFSKTASGTKVITVSYPLTDYEGSDNFEVMKRFTGTFTWGEADIYLHMRK